MLWSDLEREIAGRSGAPAVAEARPLIYVDSSRQQLHCLFVTAEDNRCYPISTAANGLGNQVDSNRTPYGLHRIRQKIGADDPKGMVFEARQPTGRIAGDMNNRQRDEITSRILWLDGLEDGVNHARDGSCDSYSRYIYIHGTSDEQRIGQSVSAGCIRMKNDDVIELFSRVMVDDLVLIK